MYVTLNGSNHCMCPFVQSLMFMSVIVAMAWQHNEIVKCRQSFNVALFDHGTVRVIDKLLWILCSWEHSGYIRVHTAILDSGCN